MTINELLLPPSLLFFVCGLVLVLRQPTVTETIRTTPSLDHELQGQLTELACLLEDAPESALKGQYYELATPLMTPFACIVVETWRRYYQNHLGKPGINYWQWRNQPEATNICPELTWLMILPEPKGFTQDILQSLGNISSVFRNQELVIQLQMRFDFWSWHQRAIAQVGIIGMKAIYQQCYGVSWETVIEIFKPITDIFHDQSLTWWQILHVSRHASQKQVEIAYKRLVKLFHPDVNGGDYATAMTARLNWAYEQYQIQSQIKAHTAQKQAITLANRRKSPKSNPWRKLFQDLYDSMGKRGEGETRGRGDKGTRR